MKIIFRFLRGYRVMAAIGGLLKLAEAVLELFLPIMMADLINRGVLHGDREVIFHVGSQMLLIAGVGLCFALICQYVASLTAQGFSTRLRAALYARILRLPAAEAGRLGADTLATRLTNDVSQVGWGVAIFIRLVLRAPFLCVGSAVYAATLNLKLSLIIFLCLPILGGIVAVIYKRSAPLYTAVQRAMDRLSAGVGENIAGVRVIRAFAAGRYERSRFRTKNDELTRTVVRVNNIALLMNPLTALVMNAAVVAVLMVSGRLVASGELLPGTILAFINYITMMLSSLLIMTLLVTTFTKAGAGLRRVHEVLEAPVEQPDEGRSADPQSPAPVVACEGVSFTYPGAMAPALTNLSFVLERGQTLGMIGGTGSGKTTLLRLLLRQYLPDNGRVLLHGSDTNTLSPAAVRVLISIAPQTPGLWADSVKNNLSMGRPVSDAALLHALSAAAALEFVEALPGGLNAPIERGGQNLSGGQRARLGIARALLKESSLLILDDSFAALDYITERRIKTALKDYAFPAVILVSQRLSAVRSCDRILVLHEGGMAGFGTHDELMADCEVYRDIVRTQTAEEAV